jgi:hypothetical protein
VVGITKGSTRGRVETGYDRSADAGEFVFDTDDFDGE